VRGKGLILFLFAAAAAGLIYVGLAKRGAAPPPAPGAPATSATPAAPPAGPRTAITVVFGTEK